MSEPPRPPIHGSTQARATCTIHCSRKSILQTSHNKPNPLHPSSTDHRRAPAGSAAFVAKFATADSLNPHHFRSIAQTLSEEPSASLTRVSPTLPSPKQAGSHHQPWSKQPSPIGRHHSQSNTHTRPSQNLYIRAPLTFSKLQSFTHM